jgi:hypothetical protein
MGYSYQRPVGTSPEGNPIYLYKDPGSDTYRYVVVGPDGRAFYSDPYGRILQPGGGADPGFVGAVVGGLVGFIAGPVGVIVGAVAGAVALNLLSKHNGRSY